MATFQVLPLINETDQRQVEEYDTKTLADDNGLNDKSFKDIQDVVKQLNDASHTILENTLRYTKVTAVVVYWKESDVDNVIPKYAHELIETFRMKYKFDPCEIALEGDSEDAQRQYQHAVSGQLVKLKKAKNEQHETLFILYYGGHGVKDYVKARGGNVWGHHYFWASSRSRKDGPSLDWTKLQDDVLDHSGDILFIFDCCHAEAMVPDQVWGKRRVEFLGATGVTEEAGGELRTSFTRALNEELKRHKENDDYSFLVSELRLDLSNEKKMTQYGLKATPVYRKLSPPQRDNMRIGPLGTTSDTESGTSSKTLNYYRGATNARMLIKVRFSDPSTELTLERILVWLKTNMPSDVKELNFATARETDARVVSLFRSDSSLAIMSLPLWMWDLFPSSDAWSAIGIVRSGDLLRPALEALEKASQAKEASKVDNDKSEAAILDSSMPVVDERDPQASQSVATPAVLHAASKAQTAQPRDTYEGVVKKDKGKQLAAPEPPMYPQMERQRILPSAPKIGSGPTSQIDSITHIGKQAKLGDDKASIPPLAPKSRSGSKAQNWAPKKRENEVNILVADLNRRYGFDKNDGNNWKSALGGIFISPRTNNKGTSHVPLRGLQIRSNA